MINLPSSIPSLYATEHDQDPIVHAVFVHPRAGWRWFLTEFDGQDLCFGLIEGLEVEFGYFRKSELETNGCGLLPAWLPVRLSAVREPLFQVQG
jgi:hypothetical protein